MKSWEIFKNIKRKVKNLTNGGGKEGEEGKLLDNELKLEWVDEHSLDGEFSGVVFNSAPSVFPLTIRTWDTSEPAFFLQNLKKRWLPRDVISCRLYCFSALALNQWDTLYCVTSVGRIQCLHEKYLHVCFYQLVLLMMPCWKSQHRPATKHNICWTSLCCVLLLVYG